MTGKATPFRSEKLKRAWRKAASIYRKGKTSRKLKKSVFYGSVMKIFMDLVKADVSLRDEFIRVYGHDPRSGENALSSSVDPSVANERFPITLKIEGKPSLGGFK